MNNKVAKKIYQKLNLKNKLSKQKEETESWIWRVFLMVARWEGGCRGRGEEVRGLRSTNR